MPKKPRAVATVGSVAVIDPDAVKAVAVVNKKKQVVAAAAAAAAPAVAAAAAVGGYRDRAAERRGEAVPAQQQRRQAAAGVAAGGEGAVAGAGAVKGKVYGGKVRTPGGGGSAGDSDPFKASVQQVALDRFKAAMQ